MTPNLKLDGCLKRPYKTKRAAETALQAVRETRAIEVQKYDDVPERSMPTRVYGPCKDGNYHLTSMLPALKSVAQARQEARNNTVHRRENDHCARCGAKSVEKISNRGGGREKPGVNDISHHLRPSNFFLTCLPCYNTLHGTSAGRTEGWFLKKSDAPHLCPVLYRGVWSLLNDKGDVKPCRENECPR